MTATVIVEVLPSLDFNIFADDERLRKALSYARIVMVLPSAEHVSGFLGTPPIAVGRLRLGQSTTTIWSFPVSPVHSFSRDGNEMYTPVIAHLDMAGLVANTRDGAPLENDGLEPGQLLWVPTKTVPFKKGR